VELERIAIALRARSGWEAIDLGFRMALRWAWPLWRVWLALFLPVLAVLCFALQEQPVLAALLLWWLKPVFDRFLLHVLSRAVFGEVPGLGDTLGAWRSCIDPRLAFNLLLRPFAWTRSFLAPVAQLEGQRGAAGRQRAALLGRRVGGHVLALALVCLAFEGVVMAGLGSLVELLQPGGWLAEADANEDAPFWEPTWWGLRETLFYAAAVTLVEPLFVAAGFSLYLNRRVLLEGWDIELGLRRLLSGAAALLLGVALLLALPGASPAWAKPPPKDESKLLPVDKAVQGFDPETPLEIEAGGCRLDDDVLPSYVPLATPARDAVVEVLADPDFGGMRTVTGWQPRERERDTTDLPELGWLGELGSLMASALRALSWVVILALALALLWSLLRRWRGLPPEAKTGGAPETLFGLAIAPDSLPDDVAAAALAALEQGRLREALSLLYRGALSRLVHARGLRIGEGATEGDVLRLVRRRLPGAAADYFARLLPAWIALAYGHRAPQVEQVHELCIDYARHFGSGATMEPAA
jgi:hypothetical protein